MLLQYCFYCANLRRLQSHPPVTMPAAAGERQQPASVKATKYDEGTNFVDGGVESNPYFFALIVALPFLAAFLAYLTSPEAVAAHGDLATRPISAIGECLASLPACAAGVGGVVVSSLVPTAYGAKFVLSFMGVALLLERLLPGKVETGPMTATGHVPRYVLMHEHAVRLCRGRGE
jgi:hypothetical protein